jgi:hypothetical protein
MMREHVKRGENAMHRRRGRSFKRALIEVSLVAVCGACRAVGAQEVALPEAPSAILARVAAASADAGKDDGQGPETTQQTQKNTANTDKTTQATTPAQDAANQRASAMLPPCPTAGLMGKILFLPGATHDPCQEEGQLQAIVDPGHVKPMSSAQKGELAIWSVLDPFNLLSITAFSAISIAANSHSAYGPGFAGFGRLTGYSLVGDVQGEFLGTYLIPVLTHEDPRYHRMGRGPIPRRALHAVLHTYVTQHDDGRLMPNFSVLAGYPVGNVLSNLYVPGIATNGEATARRIVYGIALNPVGDVVAEFLPDVARRIHVRVLFVQQILNKVAQGSGTPP